MKPEDGVAAYGLGLPSSFILRASDREFWRRVIDQFIVSPDAHGPTGPSENQLWWFHVVDIVLTATLLSGSADPIHKVMDAFRKFMEA